MCVPLCFQLAWHIPISFPVLLSYTMPSFFTSLNASSSPHLACAGAPLYVRALFMSFNTL